MIGRTSFGSRVSFVQGPASLRYTGSGRGFRDTLNFQVASMHRRFVLAFDLRAERKNAEGEAFASIEFGGFTSIFFVMYNGSVWLSTAVVRDGANADGPTTPMLQIRQPSDWHHYEVLYDATNSPATLTLVVDGQAIGDGGSRSAKTLPSDFGDGMPLVTFGRVYCGAEDAGEDRMLFDNVTFKGQ